MSAEVTNGANVASVTARSSTLLRSNVRLKMFSSCSCLMILEYVHGVHGVCVGVQALEFRDNVDGAELYFCCVTVNICYFQLVVNLQKGGSYEPNDNLTPVSDQVELT